MAIRNFGFFAAALCGSSLMAVAGSLNQYLSVSGTTVPTAPEVIPGFSGYTVVIHATTPGSIVTAVDVGLNKADFPNVSDPSLNYGLFGPEHQLWPISNSHTTTKTPYQFDDDEDSHFLFNYNIAALAPEENNNVSPHGIGSPYEDDAHDDWGVGDTMRAIVGVANMQTADLPLAYLVIPDGQSVQFVGMVATTAGFGPLSGSDGGISNGPQIDVNSIVTFSIGVPEPMTGAAAFAGLFANRLIRRRR